MKKVLLLAVIASALFASCQKNNSATPDTAVNVPGGFKAKARAITDPDIYVAGNYQFSETSNNSQAVYWKNFDSHLLPAVKGYNTSKARAVAVSGADVYVVGYDHGKYGQATTTGVPCYWKNNVETALPIPAGTTGIANAVVTNGTDVYIAGYYVTNDATHSTRAVMWKNGVATTIAFNKESSCANAIALDGTDVYICGDASINGVLCGIYWKNNDWHPFAGTSKPSHAISIAALNHNYYIYGYENHNPVYWKDGNAVSLPHDNLTYPADNNMQESIAQNNVAVDSVGGVYVGGFDHATEAYWKNGIENKVTIAGQSSAGGVQNIVVDSNNVYTEMLSTQSGSNAWLICENNEFLGQLSNVCSIGKMALVNH